MSTHARNANKDYLSGVSRFFSRLHESVLPNAHPKYTARVLAFGVPVNERGVMKIAKASGLENSGKFTSFLSGYPLLGQGDLAHVKDRYFYDGKNDETVLRVRGIRPATRPGLNATADAETFVIRGRYDWTTPVTNSRLGLFRYKSALERAGYKTAWSGWKGFDIFDRPGENFGCAFRHPDTNELIYSFSGRKPHQSNAEVMAMDRGFKSNDPDVEMRQRDTT